MVRGTFANVRLKNKLAPGTEGGFTRHLPDGAADVHLRRRRCKYQQEGVPLMILAGKEYGSGSSRDWAAKGPMLLGVRAVIAESYERIHRSNLVGMGILPLQFQPGETAASLGLTGEEVYDLAGPGSRASARTSRPASMISVKAQQGATARSRRSRRGAHRHAAGSALLPARRHLAVCAAACWRGSHRAWQMPWTRVYRLEPNRDGSPGLCLSLGGRTRRVALRSHTQGAGTPRNKS